MGDAITPKLSEDQLDAEVLFQLKRHLGKGHPIGRWELVEKIYGITASFPRNDGNVYDRKIREAVNRLRKQGVLICDMGDGAGRFLPESMDEYRAFRTKFTSFAYDIIETAKEMDKAAITEFPDGLQPKLL